MGIFGDYILKYYEAGLPCLPCENEKKKPAFGGWQAFCDRMPTEAEVETWSINYSHLDQIGLCMGKSSGIVAFDFDYDYDPKKVKIDQKDFEKDQKRIEKAISAMLPATPVAKKGKKGWTRFYKWTPDLDEKSNIQCDRNSVRLFDFLSWHKQTILPPSIHSTEITSDESKRIIRYKWIGTPLEDCLGDLPEIDINVIRDIALLYGENGSKDNSRHGRLLRFMLTTIKIQKDINKTAEFLIRRDLELNKDNPYLSDKKHFKTGDALTNAINWITRVDRWASDKSSTKEISKLFGNDQETFFEFFRQILPDYRKEMLSKRVLYKESYIDAEGKPVDEWHPIDNKLKALRSDAVEVGLNRSYVEDHLFKFKEILKPRFLFDIPEWDGFDRLEKILRLAPASNYVEIGQHVLPDEYEKSFQIYMEIWKDIAAGLFKRAYNPKYQNLAPILRGKQEKGKNTFIEKVFGEPFGEFYWDNISISQDQQKNYDAVDGKIVIVIGEFDQTSKVQISHIKELITNNKYSARRAYERSSDSYRLHHTIFSASNFDNVLKDTSGNRRFVIFNIDHINFDYNQFCDKDQLLAQFHHLYKTNYKMSASTRVLMRLKVEGETPDDPIEAAMEYYKLKFKDEKLVQRTQSPWLTNAEVVELITKVSQQTGVKTQWIRQRLKGDGLAKKTKDGVIFKNLLVSNQTGDGLKD